MTHNRDIDAYFRFPRLLVNGLKLLIAGALVLFTICGIVGGLR